MLGDQIKSRRLRLKLTQAEVAHQIGISQAALSRIEAGKRWPRNEELLAAIARALRTTPAQLLK